MTLDTWEQSVRFLGLGIFAVTLAHSAVIAFVARDRRVGRSSGLAERRKALAVYGLGALPWFLLFVVFWRPLPVDPDDGVRIALLGIGSLLGLTGVGLYQWGRHELGAMYNVSSSLGTQLYEGHRLVTTGPYALCRHPMYLGLAFAALGGLAVYRTWSFVFALAALVPAASKAVAEERLLADEFGEFWTVYAATVPRWFPLVRGTGRIRKEESHVDTGPQQG